MKNEAGKAASGIILAAIINGPSSGPPSITRTDNAGHYCFPHLAPGEYFLSADDPQNGYPSLRDSLYSTDPLPHANVRASQPPVTVNWRIPYKAARVHLRVIEAGTGKPLPQIAYSLKARRRPEYRWTRGATSTDTPLLLPPDEDIVLRVSAPGYREWHDDRAGGGFLNYPAGSDNTLEVSLEPVAR